MKTCRQPESNTALTTACATKKSDSFKASEQSYWAKDFANIPLITDTNGVILTVGDVATVRDMFADDSYHLSRYNGTNGYGIQLLMDEYGDVTKMVQQAHEVVDAWHEKGLPEGVELETWYDKSTLVTERLTLHR